MIRAFLCCFSALFFFLSSNQPAAAQHALGGEPTGTPLRLTADESYQLSIALREINERMLAAGSFVELGEADARGLQVRVGVFLTAGNINVLLRNVAGQVRFRASLEPLLRRIKSHRQVVKAQ